jgi:hypothetical protein
LELRGCNPWQIDHKLRRSRRDLCFMVPPKDTPNEEASWGRGHGPLVVWRWDALRIEAQAGGDWLRTRRLLLVAHAGYYVVTGAWPLVSRRTFEKVTGPKEDFWLAQTVGVLVGAIGLGLAQSLRRPGDVSAELQTVAVASAAGLALVDVIFVSKACIRRIYLLDAFAEVALVASWHRTSQS